MIRNNKLNLIRLFLITLSIVFIFVGIYQGEHLTVLQKAINICLECIGVG